MGGEGVEVQVEAVTRKDRNAAGSQGERDRMEEGMGQVLSPRPDLQGGHDLSHRIKGDPHSEVCALLRKVVNNSSNWRCPRCRGWKK